MPVAEKDKVIGKALYMEFRQGSQTYQVIVTPDGVTNEGRVIPSSIYRRQLSRSKPRRAWKHFTLPSIQVNEFGVFESKTKEDSIKMGLTRAEFLSATFNQLSSYKYVMYKLPLLVEVSQDDLNEIRLGRTPYKILGRITRVRKAQGFSEELFA